MDITQIIVAVIGAAATVVVAIITSVLVPWIKANTSETAQAILEAVAQSAVLFVQQTMSDSASSEKLAAAVGIAEEYLSGYGVSFDEAAVTAEIEAALKQMKLASGGSWK